jgi:hypothetical protein
MQKWEYKLLRRWRGYNEKAFLTDWSAWFEDEKKLTPPIDMVIKIAELGAQGWELVSVTARAGSTGDRGSQFTVAFTSSELWVFKRPVAPGTPPLIPKA